MAAATGATLPPELERFKAAEAERREWDGILTEAYRFAVPNHDPNPNAARTTQGESRTAQLFDSTAVVAVKRRRARMHGALFPPFREWMSFAPSGDIDLTALPQDRATAWRQYEETARRRFHSAIERSNFHTEIAPALADVQISIGAILLQPGTLDDPLRFEAVPVRDLIPREGPSGKVEDVYRRREVRLRDLARLWPEAADDKGGLRDEDLAKMLAEAPETKVALVECCERQPDGTYRYTVWWEAKARRLLERGYRRAPWLVFRMDKAPGETMGRGPVLDVLPDIKTANKVVELTLKNASIAVTGIWQADDDGVLNPANVKLVPGTIIPKAVGSAGLTPLNTGARFDVSQIILADLRQNIRETIEGPTLPGSDDTTRRTAYEWTSRERQQEAVEVPVNLRLLQELDQPLVLRALDILMSPAMAGSPYAIEPWSHDGQDITPVPVNPLIRLQDMADAERALQALAKLLALMPEAVGQVVDPTAFARWFLEYNGFPTRLLIEASQMVSAAQQQQQAQQQAAMAEIGNQGLAAMATAAGRNMGDQLTAPPGGSDV